MNWHVTPEMTRNVGSNAALGEIFPILVTLMTCAISTIPDCFNCGLADYFNCGYEIHKGTSVMRCSDVLR